MEVQAHVNNQLLLLEHDNSQHLNDVLFPRMAVSIANAKEHELLLMELHTTLIHADGEVVNDVHNLKHL